MPNVKHPGRPKRGPGRPKTPKWKQKWKAWEKAQKALQSTEQKTFHTTVPRVGLPPATKTVEFPGGKTLDIKTIKPEGG